MNEYKTRYTARFAPLEYWDTADQTKRGFIPVEFEGEIVWARPIFNMGSFTVPTKKFVEENRDKVAVIVEVLDGYAGKLAWSGFTYWEGKTPKDTQEEFPFQKIVYSDEQWQVFINTNAEHPTFNLTNIDGTQFEFYRKEDSSHLVYEDGVLGHMIKMNEDVVHIHDGVNDVTIESSDEGIKVIDNVNGSSLELGPKGIKLSDGQNHTKLDSKKLSLGEEDSNKEPVILGDRFVQMLNTVLQALATHIHPTGTGPSGPPTNANIFTQEKGKTESLKSNTTETQ